MAGNADELSFIAIRVCSNASHLPNQRNVGVYTIQQTSSKLPGNVFKIHVNCWTFAGSLLDVCWIV